MSTALWLSLGMAIGNFLWQAATQQNWDVAVDRSYFQLVACVTMAFLLRTKSSRNRWA